jgi:hypothetical protein
MGKNQFDNPGVNRSNSPSSLTPFQTTAPATVGAVNVDLAAARAADPQSRPYARRPVAINRDTKNPNANPKTIPGALIASEKPPVRKP